MVRAQNLSTLHASRLTSGSSGNFSASHSNSLVIRVFPQHCPEAPKCSKHFNAFTRLYRFVLSYLASGCFILLASGATYGALAANQLLGLNGKTAGYAVTGLTTSVLVPVLNVIHYQACLHFRTSSAECLTVRFMTQNVSENVRSL